MAIDHSFIYLVVVLAYVFDFINGFHDAANSIATIVATEVLTPLQAVCWAAFFNFIAFMFFKLSVAHTIGTGLVQPDVITPTLLFSGLCSAIAWNLLTWYFGLPSSSSHALVGGLIGAGFYAGGWHVLVLSGISKVLIAIILSPLLGAIIAIGLMTAVKKLSARLPHDEEHQVFRYFQLFSAAALSLSHGGNDAQKTMGIITILLFSANLLQGDFYVPLWVIISCNFVIAMGTLAGGWRIVHTLGRTITHLNPKRGCCAETGAAITIGLATNLGVPVSTTHTVTGAIAGVGIAQGSGKTKWDVLRKIISAWFLTVPMTFMLAMLLQSIATHMQK